MDGFRLPLGYPPFSIDVWRDAQHSGIERELGLITDLKLARAAFWQATALFPGATLTLRQRAHVIGSTERLHRFQPPPVRPYPAE